MPQRTDPAPSLSRDTLVDQLVTTICREIFAGELQPGDRIPAIRALAQRHGVTVPTAQRAIARIEELGLLKVLHGSGMTVLDPAQNASLGAFPHWALALRDDPSRATEVLCDFLELRRLLATRLATGLRGERGRPAYRAVEKAVASFEAVAAEKKIDLTRVMEADLAVARAILACRPQAAFASVFNTLERMLRRLPELQEAIYGQPSKNALGYRAMFQVLGSGKSDAEVNELLDTVLERTDKNTIARFRAALKKRATRNQRRK